MSIEGYIYIHTYICLTIIFDVYFVEVQFGRGDFCMSRENPFRLPTTSPRSRHWMNYRRLTWYLDGSLVCPRSMCVFHAVACLFHCQITRKPASTCKIYIKHWRGSVSGRWMQHTRQKRLCATSMTTSVGQRCGQSQLAR